MGRPKGSKNKPKQESVPVPSEPKKPEVRRDADFIVQPDDVVVNNFDVFCDTPIGNVVSQVMSASYNKTNGCMVVNTHAQDVMNLYKDTLNYQKDIKNSHNKEKLSHFISDDESKWKGGKYQDILDALKGKFDQSSFLKKREQIKKQFSKLKELESLITRRRVRYMSEHDGELDFDRRWELNPFHATRFSNNGVARTLDVNIEFCLSAGVDAEAINEYGCTMWAVIDMLESAGIQCNINLVTTLTGLSYKDDDSKESKIKDGKLAAYKFIVCIKRAGEYVDTMDIARCFTSNFYRRVIFNTWGMFTEGVGRELAYGLGRPHDFASSLQNNKGQLNFKIEQMSNYKLNQDELINYIKEAL